MSTLGLVDQFPSITPIRSPRAVGGAGSTVERSDIGEADATQERR